MSLVRIELLTLAVVTAVAPAAGCDSQAEPDYPGEPVATLRGMVVNNLGESPPDLEAAVLWLNSSGTPDMLTAETVSVSGEFPARFQLDVYQPPIDDALNDLGDGEARIGVAFIAALSEGTGESSLYGLSERWLLVYADADIEAGSDAAGFVGGPLQAGFHVMDVIDVDDPACAEETFDCLRPAADGFDTEIEIRIDDEELLDVPNWS